MESGEHQTAGARLLANKERIVARWTQLLREQIPAASHAPQPVLVDTVPGILDAIAKALSNPRPSPDATRGSTVANEHGGERVRLMHFRLEDLVDEYRLLRQVVFEILEEGGSISRDEWLVLNASLDGALKEACSGFTLVQAAFRDQFFATLAHDLRNPLSAALTSAGLVLRRPLDQHVPRWAARVVQNIERVDHMLQDLLDAMRVQSGARLPLRLELVDVADIIELMVEDLRVEHGDRFLVHSISARGHLDADALRRALENLANNAVKYGDSNRPITIAVRMLHGRLLLTVHNHGPPIPIEHQETLFRAFHRMIHPTSSGQRGWGLGLAQARAVAEAHGGSIGIDSTAEHGTTFTIDVPLDARPFQQTPVTPGVPAPEFSPPTHH
jgi:signal transduction histidine kinase